MYSIQHYEIKEVYSIQHYEIKEVYFIQHYEIKEVYSIQHYEIKFASELRHVSGFLWVLHGFLHQYKWPPWYNWNIVESSIKHHKPTNLEQTEQLKINYMYSLNQ